MTVLVKICGLSTQDTLDAALAAGVDMVGLVFFPRSPRNVSLEMAAALASRAAGRATVVALTVDADDAALDAIRATVRPDLWQLHGAETPERVAAVRARTGLPVMKVLGIADADDLAAIQPYLEVSDRLLFDAKPPKGAAALPGGNGVAFDWSLLAGLDLPRPAMLSGGLDASSVARALTITGLPGVDVSSGVERAPGDKDPARIAAFVAAARGTVVAASAAE
jgi:phosphoribosylanthranilate isomerase